MIASGNVTMQSRIDELKRLFVELTGGSSRYQSIIRIASAAAGADTKLPGGPRGDYRSILASIPTSAERRYARLILMILESVGDSPGADLLPLWKHSLYCGKIAERIGARAGFPHPLAFPAGFLHDIGKILLSSGSPQRFEQSARLFNYHEGRISTSRAEKETLGTDHAALGAFAASEWGLPYPIAAVIGRHHRPRAGSAEKIEVWLGEIVCAADAFCWKLGFPSIKGANPYTDGGDAQSAAAVSLQLLGIGSGAHREAEAEFSRELTRCEALFESLKEKFSAANKVDYESGRSGD